MAGEGEGRQAAVFLALPALSLRSVFLLHETEWLGYATLQWACGRGEIYVNG